MKRSHRFVDTNKLANKRRYNISAVLVFLFFLFQLNGCSVVEKQFATYDGPPKNGVDVSKLKDAVPKVEPLHPYGTRDYVLNGRHYRVLKSAKGYVKYGNASWYGSKFHGGLTSTQERFNLYGMTAASPHLPLPCYVQVTNQRNGKKVVVRVNDRGPFHGDRILDLSYAAAMKLGFGDDGVVPVKIVAIDPKTWDKFDADSKTRYAELDKKSLLDAKSFKKNRIFLQLGAFAKLDNAKQVSDKANKITDEPVLIRRKKDLYHVHIGPFASSAQGDKLKNFLEQSGFEHITKIEG